MSRHAWAFSDRSPGGYYRDRENGWIFGVCAGLAEFANFRVGTVRIITLICLVLFFWPTVFIYAAIAVLVKEKPLIYAGRDAEYQFWRRHDSDSGRWSHR